MTFERPVGSTPTHYLVDEHYQPLPDLRALAAAADKGGEHIYTHWRDSNAAKANEAWCRAASPELVIGLLDRIASLEAQQERTPLTNQQQKALDICLARGNVNVALVAEKMGISWKASFDLCQSLADRPWLVQECAISPVLDQVESKEQ